MKLTTKSGDLDQPKMVRAVDYMATHIANAHKQITAGTAHLPNMEQPDNFNRIVLTFLQDKARQL